MSGGSPSGYWASLGLARLRGSCLVLGATTVLLTAASGCGSSKPSAPKPYTEQAVLSAFRKEGVRIPVVLHAGQSCHPDRWPVPPSTESTKAATLYACGRLRAAHIDTANLPRAVLMVSAFAAAPNYLISVYPDQLHAFSTNFWLRTLYRPRPRLPVSILRKGNVAVAGLMRRSEIAAVNRAFANLKQ
jgi:hypothetical protein